MPWLARKAEISGCCPLLANSLCYEVSPLSLPTRPWQSYSVILIGLLFLSSYIYWHITASCYDEGSDNFPGPVFCHYTLLFLQRNTCSGNQSLPLTSSSSRRTGLGYCCLCLILCCSSSHMLLPLHRAIKMRWSNRQNFFSPPECKRQLEPSGAAGASSDAAPVCTSLLWGWSGSGRPGDWTKAVQVVVSRYVPGRKACLTRDSTVKVLKNHSNCCG